MGQKRKVCVLFCADNAIQGSNTGENPRPKGPTLFQLPKVALRTCSHARRSSAPFAAKAGTLAMLVKIPKEKCAKR